MKHLMQALISVRMKTSLTKIGLRVVNWAVTSSMGTTSQHVTMTATSANSSWDKTTLILWKRGITCHQPSSSNVISSCCLLWMRLPSASSTNSSEACSRTFICHQSATDSRCQETSKKLLRATSPTSLIWNVSTKGPCLQKKGTP